MKQLTEQILSFGWMYFVSHLQYERNPFYQNTLIVQQLKQGRISKSLKGVTLKTIGSPSSRVTRLQTVEKDEESCGGICTLSDYCFHEWL